MILLIESQIRINKKIKHLSNYHFFKIIKTITNKNNNKFKTLNFASTFNHNRNLVII